MSEIRKSPGEEKKKTAGPGSKAEPETQKKPAEKAKADPAADAEKAAGDDAKKEAGEPAENVKAAETGENEGADEAPQEEKEGRKSLFGQKKDKAAKTDPLKEQVEELKDKCMRQMAEFENFRKRTEREKAQMFDTGASHVLEKLLPVVDNFERGLAAAPEGAQADAFADGMNMIYKQLTKMLEDLGVTPIEALGKPFDPNFHNAVMQVTATEEYPSGTVAQEMQKGYLYHDNVLRHSMVAVAE